MKQLLSFIHALHPLEENALENLSSIVASKSVAKGAVIYSSNLYCRELFFIETGLVKMQFNSEGNEFIMRFFEENLLCTDLESFNTKNQSKYEIVAIENTELLTIPFDKFEALCAEHHSLETFYRKLMTTANLNMMARIKEMLEEDARKRYENFIQKNPDLIQRISLGDLSKYLGITQVSLSRIRSAK